MNNQIKHLLKYTNQDDTWNQKIRDMANECGIATQWSYSREMIMPVNYKNIEQFAELIIKECGLAVAKANNPLGRNIDKVFEMHFGEKK